MRFYYNKLCLIRITQTKFQAKRLKISKKNWMNVVNYFYLKGFRVRFTKTASIYFMMIALHMSVLRIELLLSKEIWNISVSIVVNINAFVLFDSISRIELKRMSHKEILLSNLKTIPLLVWGCFLMVFTVDPSQYTGYQDVPFGCEVDQGFFFWNKLFPDRLQAI